MRARLLTVTAALSLTAVTAACGGGPSTPPSASTSTVSTHAAPSAPGPMKITEPYSPTIDPSAFTTTIDNPYFPLTPGTRTIYEAATPDGLQRTTTEVTRDTKKIMGVNTVVVHDTVTIDNEPFEDTLDWYAQDREGNVWYFGEATKEFKDGEIDTAGSFEGGVDGALPGIIMPGAHASRRSVPAGVRQGRRRGHRRGAQPQRQRNHPAHRARYTSAHEPTSRGLMTPQATDEPGHW
jgi:hypothetical protein